MRRNLRRMKRHHPRSSSSRTRMNPSRLHSRKGSGRLPLSVAPRMCCDFPCEEKEFIDGSGRSRRICVRKIHGCTILWRLWTIRWHSQRYLLRLLRFRNGRDPLSTTACTKPSPQESQSEYLSIHNVLFLLSFVV